MQLRTAFTTTATTITILLFAVSLLMAAQAETVPKPEISLEGKLNVNSATLTELNLLPGIGKKTAENIISYRTANNGFKTVNEVLKVKGLGKKTLQKIEGFLMLAGETTLVKK